MNAISSAHAPASLPSSHLALAREPESAWAALGLTDLVPPDSLAEARARRDDLGRLLRREREAAADFLLALADFDRRRAWERLGHASLFAFLTRELGLSAGAAQLRLSAARLLPRHAAVEAALRSGRLCLSAVGQLARVLTPENEPDVLPRFLGLSSREAAEVVAELLPRTDPPRRDLVTAPASPPAPALLSLEPSLLAPPSAESGAHAVPSMAQPSSLPPLHAHEVPPPSPSPLLAPPAEPPKVEPLTADLRRLHVTVSRGFLEKVERARDGLSQARPGATTEQVLEAALDLLLERQDRRRGLVKRPRRTTSAPPPAQGAASTAAPQPAPTPPTVPPSPTLTRRPHIPAAVAREVRRRDGGRCQFPLDAGGVCGAIRRIQLDHVLPLALGGATDPANLRCLCATHNRLAARLSLGPALASCRGRPRTP